VVNDSVAALLGARVGDPSVSVGLILGTGINLCYAEPISRIPKLTGIYSAETMIISTEIGEFRGIPKTVFEESVIASSDDPALAQAEKQCAGAYLAQVICRAWQQAAREDLLPPAFLEEVSLPQISDYLADLPAPIPESPAARQIARVMVHRAAKIAAILAAGGILRSCPPYSACTLVIEGSQFEKLTGFAPAFRQELSALLQPYNIDFEIIKVENSCLLGAALAAFAEPM